MKIILSEAAKATRHKSPKSSNIAEVIYDAESSTLYVKFHGSGWYSYANVPAEEHGKLITAESIGKQFHAAIRSKYQGVKVDLQEITEIEYLGEHTTP